MSLFFLVSKKQIRSHFLFFNLSKPNESEVAFKTDEGGPEKQLTFFLALQRIIITHWKHLRHEKNMIFVI